MLNYSTIAIWMDDLLQVPVSRGYLAKLCNDTISASLADTYDQIKQAIPEQPQLGSDESSLKNNGKKHWIWCIVASLFTLFHIASSRSRSVLEELVGVDFKGFFHFDYFSANCSFAWDFDLKGWFFVSLLIQRVVKALVLLGPSDPRHSLSAETSRQENQSVGRAALGSFAADVFCLAPPR